MLPKYMSAISEANQEGRRGGIQGHDFETLAGQATEMADSILLNRISQTSSVSVCLILFRLPHPEEREYTAGVPVKRAPSLKCGRRCVRQLTRTDRMPETLPRDLQDFVDRELASGRYRSSEDIVVAGLRLLQRDRQEALEGIREGLAEMERGEGIPLDEAFCQIRQGHDVSPDA